MTIIKPQFNWSIMLTNNKFIGLILTILLLLMNCKGIDKDKVVYTDAKGSISSVFLSAKYIEKEEITCGCFMKLPVDKFIQCAGFFEVPAEDETHVPVPAGGIIRLIFFPVGSYVKAGSIMAHLENIDFIKLQQEFLEVKNQYNYFREDLKRQGELTIENASSIKKMQQAQLDFQVTEVKLYSLKAQLQLVGINPDSVDIEHLTTFIQIKTPVSGYVRNIFYSKDTYIGTGSNLFMIRTNNRLNVRLNVSEQYYKSLQKGQAVFCSPSSDSLSVFEAKLLLIDKIINIKSQTFQAHAYVPEIMNYYIPGMSVKARIKTYTDTVHIVPSKAIIYENSGAYLIIKKNSLFTRKAIKTGNSIGENTEILEISPAEENDSIVIQGLGYVNMLLTN
jgi:cobalt-zinc-cadmium efflux system membrane fusion protein